MFLIFIEIALTIETWNPHAEQGWILTLNRGKNQLLHNYCIYCSLAERTVEHTINNKSDWRCSKKIKSQSVTAPSIVHPILFPVITWKCSLPQPLVFSLWNNIHCPRSSLHIKLARVTRLFPSLCSWLHASTVLEEGRLYRALNMLCTLG